MEDPVEAALYKLIAEHEAAAERVAELKAQYEEASEQLQRLYDAVTSLQRLVEQTSPSDVKSVTVLDRRRVTIEQESAEVHEVPDVLRKYLPRGGDGKRLRSTLMVADVAGMHPMLTRDKLRERFYEHFGYDLLKKYWDNPDNAFNNAFTRAVRDGSVLEIENTKGGEPFYGGGFVDRATGIPAMYSGEEDD